MGTYTDFSVAGYPLISSKNAVLPEAMTVFRESDRRVFKRRLGDRNQLVWGDAQTDETDESEMATVYMCDTDNVIERLNIMGFTLNRARRDFDDGRQVEIAMCQEWMENGPDPLWFAEIADLLKSLTFDEYLGGLRQVVTERLRPPPFDDNESTDLPQIVRYILEGHYDRYMGFFGTDIRCLIRVVCEVAPRPSHVVQDVSDLVEQGYYALDEAVCQNSIDLLTLGNLESTNRIVLTEGATDAQVLGASLKLLYPHLSSYYSFLDFDMARVPGGAGQLTSLVKGFAAAGIGNRIIAVFDNDSAARDAMRPLMQLRLPANIAVLRYPDAELLRSYPTVGPNGNANQDVNGLAASIELYFGSDVLSRSDGSLAPVHWKGYIQSVRSYQGEVSGKPVLHAAFQRKLAQANADPLEQARQDWAGIDAILRVIFSAFTDDT